MRAARFLLILSLAFAGIVAVAMTDQTHASDPAAAPYTIVLGVAQDAGFPQAGCTKPCCAEAWTDPERRRHVSCLGIVDPASGERWIIDATPDFREQLRMLDAAAAPRSTPDLAGILLTHAHIGHYTGLMFLGHESIGAKGVPVYAMERMRTFLSTHGPWDQLVRYENIAFRPIEADVPFALNARISVTPFRVPHREEYSEVVGFRIEGPTRSVLFIPDIDKWVRWDRDIETYLADVDVAYLDGTFYANGEIPGRDMTQIPHPFIEESLARFAPLTDATRSRVRFIHLNHTNPALDPDGTARKEVEAAGCRIAVEGERAPL